MKMKDRTVLITGGSSGIGFELARRFLDLGNVVIVTGRDEAKLEIAGSKLPGVHAIRCDVSDETDIASLYDQVVNRFPALDVLVNNAGIMRDIKLTNDRTLGDVVQEIDINLNGPIRMVQKFLPHLLERPEADIINVTSGLAFVPMPLSPIYSAAKAGLRAYTRALRVQLAKTRVSVIELAPPAADSDLYRKLAGDQPQSIKPMPVPTLGAKAIQGLTAGQREIVPGLSKALQLMGRFTPEFALRQLAKASGY